MVCTEKKIENKNENKKKDKFNPGKRIHFIYNAVALPPPNCEMVSPLSSTTGYITS